MTHHATTIGFRLAGAAKMLGVSASTAKRLRARGNFPPARRLPGGPLRWFEEDVREWMRGLTKV